MKQSLPGIVFVNAGDPDLETTERILRQLDTLGVHGVELCVPYGNPFTDGETIRRSHRRALLNDVALDDVTNMVRRIRDSLSLRLYLMADWSYTVGPIGCDAFICKAAECGVDGTLVHGLPPRMRAEYIAASRRHDLPTVITVYAGSAVETIDTALADCTGFVYAVAKYGAAGSAVSFDDATLSAIRFVRDRTSKPVFVGFGVNTQQDVSAVMSTGVNGVVVGSAFVKVIEQHLDDAARLPVAIDRFISNLQPAGAPMKDLRTKNTPSPLKGEGLSPDQR
jgi:tryptophan synthase alpha chain